VLQGRSLFSAIILALSLSAAPGAAHAQIWLAEAFPEQGTIGPAKADGAVIWSHGRSVDSEDSEVEIPPYMDRLRSGGWDTFRYNRMRVSDGLNASARGLVEEVHRLKQLGYHRVALAGQSFGAFLSLMAADASDEVDAVIATAPAAYGSFSDFYDGWRNNATKLYPLMDQVRSARVMVFYFHGDDYDPGGRAERTRDILSARKLPYVVIDQPPALSSHWAAATPEFAQAFGTCILGFLDAPQVAKGAGCDGQSFTAGSAIAEVAPSTVTMAAAAQGAGARPAARNRPPQ
jgi:dienelactone hydrolase